MAKNYKLTESEIPERQTQSLYNDIIAAFLAKEAQTMKVTPEGLKVASAPTPATGRAEACAQG